MDREQKRFEYALGFIPTGYELEPASPASDDTLPHFIIQRGGERILALVTGNWPVILAPEEHQRLEAIAASNYCERVDVCFVSLVGERAAAVWSPCFL